MCLDVCPCCVFTCCSKVFSIDFQAEKNRAAAAANNLQKGCAGPMRLYVGSLHFNITEEMLRGIFEPFGKVRNLLHTSLYLFMDYFFYPLHVFCFQRLKGSSS